MKAKFNKKAKYVIVKFAGGYKTTYIRGIKTHE